MGIFTSNKRVSEVCYTVESKDSFVATTTAEDIKDSIVKFTSVLQPD